MCRNIWTKGRNEGPKAPPDMELGDPHAVGANGDWDFVRDWFLRQRRGKSDPAAVDRAPFGDGDGRPRGIAFDFDPVAFDASHAEGIGDPRARTSWDAGIVFGKGGGRGTAGRFFLGPEGITDRTGAEGAGSAHPRDKRWLDERADSARSEQFEEVAAGIAFRFARAASEHRKRVVAVQRSESAAGRGRRRDESDVGRRWDTGASTVSGKSGMAAHTTEQAGDGTGACKSLGEIYAAA